MNIKPQKPIYSVVTTDEMGKVTDLRIDDNDKLVLNGEELKTIDDYSLAFKAIIKGICAITR